MVQGFRLFSPLFHVHALELGNKDAFRGYHYVEVMRLMVESLRR